MRAEVVDLKRREEALTVGVEKDAQMVEEVVQLAARERAKAAERMEAAGRGETSTVPTSGQEAHSCSSLTHSRLSKLDNIDDNFGMWRTKVLAYIMFIGC